MIKKAARTLIAALTLSALLLTSGCLLLAAGAGAGAGVIYAQGDLEAHLSASPSQIASATERAFKELNIKKTAFTSSDLEAEILGKTATDKRVVVKTKAQADNISSVSIRVGTVGDQALSQTILDKIKKNL